jgi:hypothetical protein
MDELIGTKFGYVIVQEDEIVNNDKGCPSMWMGTFVQVTNNDQLKPGDRIIVPRSADGKTGGVSDKVSGIPILMYIRQSGPGSMCLADFTKVGEDGIPLPCEMTWKLISEGPSDLTLCKLDRDTFGAIDYVVNASLVMKMPNDPVAYISMAAEQLRRAVENNDKRLMRFVLSHIGAVTLNGIDESLK